MEPRRECIEACAAAGACEPSEESAELHEHARVSAREQESAEQGGGLWTLCDRSRDTYSLLLPARQCVTTLKRFLK